MLVNEFNKNGDSVLQWVCSAELHRTEGVHFHCAIKLQAPRRWKAVWEAISKNYSIEVDFLGFHDSYYQAWSYVTKHDGHYVTSEGHPNLDNLPPQTAAALRAKRVAEVYIDKTPSKSTKKAARLDNTAVFHIITENNLKTDKQLCSFATQQAKEGKMICLDGL